MVGTLNQLVAPVCASTATTSVKVPPTSSPMCERDASTSVSLIDMEDHLDLLGSGFGNPSTPSRAARSVATAASTPLLHGTSRITSSNPSSAQRSVSAGKRSAWSGGACSLSTAVSGRSDRRAACSRASRPASSASSQRGVKAIPSQPSPCAAARSTAASAMPPTRSGGPLGCTGRGWNLRSAGTWTCRPVNAPGRPLQQAWSTSSISSIRGPRPGNGKPSASISIRLQPTPTPRSSGHRRGCRSSPQSWRPEHATLGEGVGTAVPIRQRVVAAAMAVQDVNAS